MRPLATLQLLADPTSPSRARSALKAALPDLPAAAMNEVLLVTNELVTNAVQHAAAPVVLEVSLTPARGVVRIQVSDPSSKPPQLRHPDEDSPGGRGLLIVASLASGWGVDHIPEDGKTVWCEVATTDLTEQA